MVSDNEDYLKIYVEYKTQKKTNGGTQTTDGKLKFDVDSFATEIKISGKAGSQLAIGAGPGSFPAADDYQRKLRSKKGV